MTRPHNTMGDTATRIMLEVVVQPRPTVRSLGAAVGKSVNTVYFHLLALRSHGLVTWEWRKKGTLRPTAFAFRPTIKEAP